MAEIVSQNAPQISGPAYPVEGTVAPNPFNLDVGWVVAIVNNSKYSIKVLGVYGNDWAKYKTGSVSTPGEQPPWWMSCERSSSNIFTGNTMYDALWFEVENYPGDQKRFAAWVYARRSFNGGAQQTSWNYRVGWCPQPPGNPSSPPDFEPMKNVDIPKPYEPETDVYGKLVLTFASSF